MATFLERMSRLRRACMYCIIRNEVGTAGSPMSILAAMDKSENEGVLRLSGKARAGDRISIYSFEDEQIMDFSLVPPFTADGCVESLSILSPLGASIIGKSEGEVIDVRFLGHRNRFLLLKIHA
tara:strand:+ start:48 stop:419 length:372 start_codon:yes stop_codon:yes gene_type:complete